MPLVFALAPAVFFGLVAIILATLAVVIGRQPVPDGAPPRNGTEAAIVVAAVFAAILCLVCLVIGFAVIDFAQDMAGWRDFD